MTDFYEIDETTPGSRPRWHGPFCTEECAALAEPCHLNRRRRHAPVPDVPCSHCGAFAGSPCKTMTRDRRRLTLAPGECHPSRREAAA